jgi:ubiquinone/menaquinone biosynthesis C-methylase UbiE
MKQNQNRYIPALSLGWLTPLYDPLIGLLLRDAVFKRRLVEQARLGPGQRVLDVGCGTGSLAVLIKRSHPAVEVVGLDGDPKVLQIAQAKAQRAGVAISFDRGLADQLPYAAGSFDRVFSSLVFHHLTRDQKQGAAREIVRVLRPGGELHLADFGPPHTPLMRLPSLLVQRLEQAGDNVRGLLPIIFEQAGCANVRPTARYATLFGTLMLWTASHPTS